MAIELVRPNFERSERSGGREMLRVYVTLCLEFFIQERTVELEHGLKRQLPGPYLSYLSIQKELGNTSGQGEVDASLLGKSIE